jgi:hypothetical protein
MSAVVPSGPALPLQPLQEPTTVDDVVRNLDQIIEWSIKAQSRIGYFAVLYKRTTVAIREAIKAGDFEDGPRMEQFDVIFATRYFKALNAYFHPDEYPSLTLAWEVAFVGDQHAKPIILQHMMTGMNAHITFDLGMAAFATAANSLDTLEKDFDRVNAILASQVPGVLGVVDTLSPDLRWIRRMLPEVFLIKRVLKKLRESAWYFAIYMAEHPGNARQKQVHQASWTAAMGSWYLQPPNGWTPFPGLVRMIARREHRNVADNIRAFGRITDSPGELNEAYLRIRRPKRRRRRRVALPA